MAIRETVITKIEIEETIQAYQMYDFEVEDNHNYFVNGLLTHNSEHVPMLFIDEVDVVQDPRALKEAKMIPSMFQGYFPLTVYLSTRKFAGGLMEKTLKETLSAGGKVLRWNILDVAERITHELARVNEPKVVRYISRELPMQNLTPEEWSQLSDEGKNNFERFEAYAGIAEHRLLPVMKNNLVNRRQDDFGGLYKPLVAVLNNFRQIPVDMADAQLLCNKPSSSGLVYPRFIEDLNVLTPQQALEKIMGEDVPNNIPNYYEYLISYLMDLGIVFIGGADWGYTDFTSLIMLAILPGGEVWLLDALIEDKLELDDIVKYAVELQEKYGPDRWWADQNYPAYLKTLRRKGVKCPKFKKVVEDGIAALQGKIVDSTNKRSFFIIRTPKTVPIIEAFGEYRWALDGKGEIIEGKPYHGNDGTSDIMDSIRYPFQNIFNKGGIKPCLKTATGEKKDKIEMPKAKTLQEAVVDVNKQIMSNKVSSLAQNDVNKVKKTKSKKKILWI
jgi:hypothetical protein